MATEFFSPEQVRGFNDSLVAEFRANGGKVGGMFADAPLLLLTTTGATSGQPRIAPLSYTRDGARYVVIAAKRGAPTNPDWYHNLLAHPQVQVEVGEESFRATARVTEGKERQRLFDQMAAQRPAFIESQRRTSRQLPVIVLERVLDRDTDYAAFNRDVIAEFRDRGGSVGGMFDGLPLLLLTTTGATSGKRRVAPVLFGEDGDRLVIVASKGGSPTHPDWYHNLLAHPEVTVDVGKETFPARARVAQDAERDGLYEQLRGVIPGLEKTQASTTRQIPLVVLERAT